MCPPVVLAVSLAISVASAIAAQQQQQQQAKAQAKYQKEQGRAHNEAAIQNAQNAIREQTEQSAAERMAEMQNQEATSQKIQGLQTERLQAQGEAMASSRASGTAFDMLMSDYHRVESQKKDVMRHQREMSGVQTENTVKALGDKADSRINSQRRFVASPIAQASWGMAALGAAGDMSNKVSTYYYAAK